MMNNPNDKSTYDHFLETSYERLTREVNTLKRLNHDLIKENQSLRLNLSVWIFAAAFFIFTTAVLAFQIMERLVWTS
jgi:hypothetical protein